MARFKKGDTAYLARDVRIPADEYHPSFLMGRFKEAVTILENPLEGVYKVVGPTNPITPWHVNVSDLMHTRPLWQEVPPRGVF